MSPCMVARPRLSTVAWAKTVREGATCVREKQERWIVRRKAMRPAAVRSHRPHSSRPACSLVRAPADRTASPPNHARGPSDVDPVRMDPHPYPHPPISVSVSPHHGGPVGRIGILPLPPFLPRPALVPPSSSPRIHAAGARGPRSLCACFRPVVSGSRSRSLTHPVHCDFIRRGATRASPETQDYHTLAASESPPSLFHLTRSAEQTNEARGRPPERGRTSPRAQTRFVEASPPSHCGCPLPLYCVSLRPSRSPGDTNPPSSFSPFLTPATRPFPLSRHFLCATFVSVHPHWPFGKRARTYTQPKVRPQQMKGNHENRNFLFFFPPYCCRLPPPPPNPHATPLHSLVRLRPPSSRAASLVLTLPTLSSHMHLNTKKKKEGVLRDEGSAHPHTCLCCSVLHS